MEQMYSIVAGVEDYSEFVTWCSKSDVFQRRPGQFKCNMTVGFGPIKESYTSNVTVVKPQLVRVSTAPLIMISTVSQKFLYYRFVMDLMNS